MSIRTCIILALCTGTLGLALRMLVPVGPVDAQFVEVVRHYDSLRPPKPGHE